MSEARDTPPVRIAFGVLEVPVALGLGFGAYVVFYRLGCAWARCVDLSGLPWFLAGSVIGLGVAVTYWACGWYFGARLRTRLVVNVLAVLFSIGAVNMPEPARRSEVTRGPPARVRAPSAGVRTPPALHPDLPAHPPSVIAK